MQELFLFFYKIFRKFAKTTGYIMFLIIPLLSRQTFYKLLRF